jgi:hypothetical protein
MSTISLFPPIGASSSAPATVQYAGAQLDSFGRLRVSQPDTLFDSQNRYGADTQFDTSTGTGGSTTALTDESSVQMSVTTTSGSFAYRQSYRSFAYQPGKSLLVLATFVMNAGKTGLRQRVGYFNTQNGVFFQQDGTSRSFVLRSSVTGSASDARTVTQANWNGDKLNGTGPSGLTLDVSKAQILFMDFEWLGVGSVRCGFVINGQYIICHTFENANQIANVYMTTATLPIRYEIENTGATASASSMKQICSSVMSEGGYSAVVAPSLARRTTILSSIGTTFVPLVSIRLKASRTGAVVLPYLINCLPTSTANYEFALVKNATLTSASWNNTSSPNVEFDVASTSMTGGTIVQSDFVSSSNQSAAAVTGPTGYNYDLQLGATVGGTSDIYTLGVRVLSGSSGDAIGSIAFYDLTRGG